LRLKVERSPHPGQHLSIYGIGFGAGAIRLSKPACLERVHLDQGELLAERRLEHLMIRPRRFEHDPCHCCRAQPFFQRSKSRRRIFETLRCIIFQPEDSQMGF
jgi:hypothetical protein